MRSEASRSDIFLWLAIAVFLSASVVQIVRRGPLRLEKPVTVVSNGNATFYAPLLIFLAQIARTIPPGATVSLAPPTGRDPSNWLDYWVAVGQLPRQRVVFAGRFLPQRSTGEIPLFVACYGGEFVDSRFRLIRRFPEGGLYEAVH
jgi:hypothetical protein